MAIKIECPACGASYPVPDHARGKSVRCHDCNRPVAVPAEAVVEAKKKDAVSARRFSRASQPPDTADRDTARMEGPKRLLPFVVLGGGVLFVLALFGLGVLGLILLFGARPPAQPLAQDQPPMIPLDQGGAPPPPQPPPPPAVPPVMEGTIPLAVLEQIKDATVFVKMDAGAESGTGSGFLMRVDGDTAYFATNDHVVTPKSAPILTIGRLKSRRVDAPRARISVVLRSGTPREQVLPAEVVAADPDADLAVLRVGQARDLPKPIEFQQQVKLVETMPVFIFGFPFGKSLATNKGNPAITVGKGAVSSLRLDVRGELSLVQLNGDLNPGNSGGPVVDAQGRLIGVSVAAIKGTQIGMAIPAADLTQLLDGRALGAVVFKKNLVGDTADIHGEMWVLDRHHNVRLNRPVSLRLAGVVAGGEAGEFEVEASLLDPLRRIQGVSLLYARTNNAAPAQANAQGRWGAMPGAQQLPLRIEGQKAVGGFRLPAGARPDELFSFQLALVNGAGQTVCTQPRAFRVDFRPGQVALGPPPIGPKPVGPPPVGKDTKSGPTQILGGAFDPQFRDDAPPGAQLVGFDVGLGKFFNNDIIIAIRPIYATAAGEAAGKSYGTNFGRTVTVKAKAGYAVGAITGKAGLTMDGFSVTFMRIDGARLDPTDAYRSEWIGGRGGGGETLLGGSGTPVVGIVGKTNNNGNCTGFGLLLR